MTPPSSSTPPVPDARWWWAVACRVLRHPQIWFTAPAVLLRTARPRWWRSRPFLPLPDAGYLRFRMETQYGGDGTSTPDPDDVITYLRWCRRNGVR